MQFDLIEVKRDRSGPTWKSHDTDEPLSEYVSEALFQWIETGTTDLLLNGKIYMHPATIEDGEIEPIYVVYIKGRKEPYAYTFETKSLVTDYIEPSVEYEEPFNYEGFTPNESINIYSWITGKTVKHDIFIGSTILKYTNDPRNLKIRKYKSSEILTVKIVELWPKDVEEKNVLRYQNGKDIKEIQLPPVETELIELYHVSVYHPAYPGLGVRASKNIPKGTILGCYAGDFYPDKFINPGKDYYMSTHDLQFIIDASRMGNMTRFFNDPTDYPGKSVNVKTDSALTLGRNKFETAQFETIKDIKKGEEIFIRYSHEAKYFEPSDFDWKFQNGKTFICDNEDLTLFGDTTLSLSKTNTWVILFQGGKENIHMGIMFPESRGAGFKFKRDKDITYVSVKVENKSYTIEYNGESHSFGFDEYDYEEFIPFIAVKNEYSFTQTVKLLNSKIQ